MNGEDDDDDELLEEEEMTAKETCGRAMCWIDLKEVGNSGSWKLADGSLPLYTNWNIQYKQPNDGYGDEHLKY